MNLNRKSKLPLYRQIANQIITNIQTGELQPGDKLPTERQLAKHYQVNRSTVVHALDELVSSGWILRKQGSGTRVTPGRFGSRQFLFSQWRSLLSGPYLKEDPFLSELNQRKESTTTIDLYTGALPNQLIPNFIFPSFSWQQIREEKEKLTSTGYAPLKQEIRHILQQQLHLPDENQDLLITSGSTQGIILLMNLLLSSGDSLPTAEPSFLFSLPLFASLQVRLVGIKQDEEGIIVSALEEAIQQKKIRLLYLTPNHQNPTGKTMSLKRRNEILAICQKYHLLIIEDDVFQDLSFDQSIPSLKSLSPHQVVYIGSLSKVFSASIKIGWLYAPKPLIKSLAKAKDQMDGESDIFPQLFAYHALKSSDYQQKQKELERSLFQRSQSFEKLLAEFKNDWQFSAISGGLYYWLTWKHQKLSRRQWSIFLEKELFVA